MRNGGLTRILITMALTLVVALPAQADRRSALAGNLLIEDFSDVFFMPHEITQYINRVWFDFVTGVDLPDTSVANVTDSLGGGAEEVPEAEPALALSGLGGPHLGSAGIVFGNAIDQSLGFGLAVHRSDFQSAQADGMGLGSVFGLHRNAGLEDTMIPRIGNMLLPIETLDWVDFLVGFALNNSMDMGARISLGSNLYSASDLDGDLEGDLNPGASATSFNLVAGLGYDTPRFTMDGSVELSIASYVAQALETADDELTDQAGTFGLGLTGRMFLNMSDSLDLGTLVNLRIGSRATDLDDGSGDETSRLDIEMSEFHFSGSAGPRYRIADVAQIAAYATVGLGQITVDPEGKNNVIDQVYFLLPGVNIAAEWYLLPWLTYRAGIHSEYNIVSG